MKPRRALILGITGQDGSFLAELLLQKGYEVHGLIRRSSSFNTSRIDHLYQDPHLIGTRLHLHYGDVMDGSSLRQVIGKSEPQEVYNLAAQSHVRVSFDMPEFTADVTGMGALRVLEAVRSDGHDIRVYQASSSEMFGSAPAPQEERTPFHPRSPYGCAKVFAHHAAVNYREAYGMFIANGILFNHECLSSRTPLIVRRNGMVDICLPAEFVLSLRRHGPRVRSFEIRDTEIWDGQQWTALCAVTATRIRPEDPNHRLLAMQARAGVVEATAHHGMLNADNEQVRADSLVAGSRVALANAWPETPSWTSVTSEMAEFLGHMASEGYVSRELSTMQYTNNDDALRERVAELWSRLFLGSSRMAVGTSGFPPYREVGQLYLNGGSKVRPWLREQLYTQDGIKRVPALILNAASEVQSVFLKAFYDGDGLKAGNGDSVKTGSPLIAQAICWLYALQGRQSSVYIEQKNGTTYYAINLSTASPNGQKGQHLRKDPSELRRIDPAVVEDDWVFDVETGSGRLCAGVGRVVVHNSERRAETFVTRKITRAVGRIVHGLQDKMFLGNLDAARDWGYAPDYVDAMWRMLQAPKADDYVIGTGISHTVREFVRLAFRYAGIDDDWGRYVIYDSRYDRPTEVDELRADASKAHKKLGWAPTTTFEQLVQKMVDHDLELARREKEAR